MNCGLKNFGYSHMDGLYMESAIEKNMDDEKAG